MTPQVLLLVLLLPMRPGASDRTSPRPGPPGQPASLEVRQNLRPIRGVHAALSPARMRLHVTPAAPDPPSGRTVKGEIRPPPARGDLPAEQPVSAPQR